MSNKNLRQAKRAKNDEFYTQLVDIERELKHYRTHFKGKVVYCNCDDPTVSNFFKYFSNNFEYLGLKKLITTCYKNKQRDLFSQHKDVSGSKLLIYEGDKNKNTYVDVEEIGVKELKGDGDFRSEECKELLRETDIVVTNPPFSLFREYVKQLVEFDKKFLIVGNLNAISYKEVFPLIRDNKLWLGQDTESKTRYFEIPDHYSDDKVSKIENGKRYCKLRTSLWFTNLEHDKRNEELFLFRNYSPEKYPKYDNYDAINVDKLTDIPKDYDGNIGVPITFLMKHNPNQFEIVDANTIKTDDKTSYKPHGLIKDKDGAINGKPKYARVIIRRK